MNVSQLKSVHKQLGKERLDLLTKPESEQIHKRISNDNPDITHIEFAIVSSNKQGKCIKTSIVQIHNDYKPADFDNILFTKYNTHYIANKL